MAYAIASLVVAFATSVFGAYVWALVH